jgi:penicillin-binding protein 1A
MGIFTSRGKKARTEKVEPRLFSGRGRASQSQRKAKPARRRRRFSGLLFRLFFTVALWGALGLAGLFGYIWFSLDQKGVLQIPAREPGIMVLAADGTTLAEQGAFFGDEVRVRELPDYVPNAVIAIEDRRYYSHFGVDPLGLMRAVYTNYKSGHLVQGGSTITQQLAKNLFLTPERTIWRKLQEVVLAVWLEARFSKEEILQLYLNRVYYGAGATGIEKAAQAYYGKSARDITLGEAAPMAGLLKAPANYSPLLHPQAAADRARLVINSMADTGAISEQEARDAIDQPAKAAASDYVPATQYIVDWVGEQLPDLVKTYSQSIVIETTIDPNLQAFAEKALRKRLNEDGAKLGVTQGALVVMDTSGAIRAMVGGKSYKRSQFNRVTKAKRQPGSAFKPFVFLAAVEQGYGPDSVEVDEPVRIGDWEPENYKQKYMGPVTLRKALALSLNTIAVKLVSYVGPGAVASVAHRLGIVSALGTDASIALGTSEVTLLELTSAFVPFANGGAPVVPYTINRITTREGVVLYERRGEGFGAAMSSYDLGSMNEMLRAVVTSGTARRAQFGEFEIAGKTGTSQDYRDAWFIGYTSHLAGGVWAGNDDNSPTQKVTGGSIPAAVWKDVMERAHAGLTPQPLPGDRNMATEEGPLVAELPGESATTFAEDRGRSGGFLDDLGKLFSSGSEEAPVENSGKKRKRQSAFERMNQNRDSK